MKIKDWKDLDNKHIKGNNIAVRDGYIHIDFDRNESVSMSLSVKMNQSEIIGHLKLLGIEVEFEKETTITQIQFYYLKWIESFGSNVSIKLSKNNPPFVAWDNGKFGQYQGDFKMFPQLEVGVDYLVSDLLNMKVEG